MKTLCLGFSCYNGSGRYLTHPPPPEHIISKQGLMDLLRGSERLSSLKLGRDFWYSDADAFRAVSQLRNLTDLAIEGAVDDDWLYVQDYELFPNVKKLEIDSLTEAGFGMLVPHIRKNVTNLIVHIRERSTKVLQIAAGST